MVKTAGMLDELRPATRKAKPVSVMSEPTLLSGRRAQAKSPVPMKPQPMMRPSAATAPRRSV